MFKHIRSWLEAYLWLPVSLLSIWAAAHFAYWLTGRRPEENADFIVGYAQRTVLIVLLVGLFSMSRQQTGFWLTKEEAMANHYMATLQVIVQLFTMGLFAYIFLH